MTDKQNYGRNGNKIYGPIMESFTGKAPAKTLQTPPPKPSPPPPPKK